MYAQPHKHTYIYNCITTHTYIHTSSIHTHVHAWTLWEEYKNTQQLLQQTYIGDSKTTSFLISRVFSSFHFFSPIMAYRRYSAQSLLPLLWATARALVNPTWSSSFTRVRYFTQDKCPLLAAYINAVKLKLLVMSTLQPLEDSRNCTQDRWPNPAAHIRIVSTYIYMMKW